MFSVSDTKMMSSFEIQSAPVFATTRHVRTAGAMAIKKQSKPKRGAVLFMVGKLFIVMCKF